MNKKYKKFSKKIIKKYNTKMKNDLNYLILLKWP